MAASRVILVQSGHTSEQVSVHALPVQVRYRGSAKVASFFAPRPAPAPATDVDPVNDVTRTQLSASFRGRQLLGERVSVPGGYRGVILRQDEREDEEELEDEYANAEDSEDAAHTEGRERTRRRITWRERAHFDAWTYWLREEAPHAEDAVQRALTWLQLAHVLHRPVIAETLQAPSKYPRTPDSPRRSSRKRARSESENVSSPRKRARGGGE